MSTRRLFGVLRILFLGLTLACIATRVIWVKAPHWVDRVDGWFVGTSLEGIRAIQAEGAEALAEGDFDRGLDRLLEFAERTASVGIGDRAERNRTRVLTLLTKEYIRRGEPAEALRWSQALNELNPRYVPNEIVRAELLAEVGRHDESIAILEVLARLGKNNPELHHKLLSGYCRLGRAEDALRILNSLGVDGPLAVPRNGWEIRHRAATGEWSRGTRFNLDEVDGRPGVYGLRFEPESGDFDVKSVRIDAPRGSRFELSSPRVTIELVGGGVIELDDDDVTTVRQIERGDGTWIGDGEIDPYVIFNAPENQEARAVRFQATLELRAPAALVDLMRSPEGRAARARVQNELEPWLQDRLEALLD